MITLTLDLTVQHDGDGFENVSDYLEYAFVRLNISLAFASTQWGSYHAARRARW